MGGESGRRGGQRGSGGEVERERGEWREVDRWICGKRRGERGEGEGGMGREEGDGRGGEGRRRGREEMGERRERKIVQFNK